MKIQSLSTHPHADGRSGEVFLSGQHCWSFTGKKALRSFFVCLFVFIFIFGWTIPLKHDEQLQMHTRVMVNVSIYLNIILHAVISVVQRLIVLKWNFCWPAIIYILHCPDFSVNDKNLTSNTWWINMILLCDFFIFLWVDKAIECTIKQLPGILWIVEYCSGYWKWYSETLLWGNFSVLQRRQSIIWDLAFVFTCPVEFHLK